MAITLKGSAETTPSGTATSKGLTLPTHAADDIGLIFFLVDEDNVTPSITVASGWTLLIGPFTNTAGRDQNVTIWWKRFTGSGDTNPTCSIAEAAENMNASVHIFSGVDKVYDPVAGIGTNYQNYAGTDKTVPGNISSSYDNACKVQWQSGSHDDWDSAGTPTGYTLGENYIANQGSTDHQQHVCAYDLNVGVAGSYAWVNFDHPTTGTNQDGWNVHMFLEEHQPIHLTDVDTDEMLALGQTGVVATGDGFESTQGTGLLELVENADYTGTKVTQTIDTWSATSIEFDVVQGALDEGTVYAFVTNDSGDRTGGLKVALGFGPYDPVNTMDEPPDMYWTMDNTYADTGPSAGTYDVDTEQSGTPGFTATPITRSSTHSLQINQRVESSGYQDSPWANITNQHTRRRVGGWIQVGATQILPGVIYEEGGGVNNIYFVIGYGTILMANIEDDADFAIQAYGNQPLTLDRPYHIMCCFDGSGDGNEFYMLIDGVKQDVTDGNPVGKINQVTHGGDSVFGDADANLQTGGQDIAYTACDDMLLAHWGSWSALGGGIPSDTEVRDHLFLPGALADDTLSASTQAAMQTALEAFDSATRDDWPLSFEIPVPSSGGPDLELTATDMVFPDEVSCHIRWLSAGVLTWRNSGTSNASSTHTPNGGTVTFIETAPVAITVRDIVTGLDIQSARVFIKADTGGPLPAGETVTITRSGSTATVSHTAHGVPDGTDIQIKGADQGEYNGIHTVTVTSANAYTYAVSGTPTTPATGTIKATSVIVNALTDAGGEVSTEIDYTSSQPIVGWSRKASAAPFYKTTQIAGSIVATGYGGTVFMIGDGGS